jgi:hypothetical protein
VQLIRQQRRRFGETSWCAARRSTTSVAVVVFGHLPLPTVFSSFSCERRRRVWTAWFVWRVLRWSTVCSDVVSGGVRVSVAATVFDGSFPLVSEHECRFVLLVFVPGSGVCFRLDGSFDYPEYGYRDRYVDVVCHQTTGCEAKACVIRIG